MKIFDVIKYEGDNRTFVWKYPGEDFNTLSQLIVHESQEALLFLNGQALDLFGPGRHTLHTNNIPLLNKIINLPMGGESPFHCEVYFVNRAEQLAVHWGMGDVNYLDPTHNDYAFRIGASGEMSLRVSDSRKIIVKLVGTDTSLDQESIKTYFKTPITMHIKTMLPAILRERRRSIFEVESDLVDLSEALRQRISGEMGDYGITLEKFWINTILKPETDPFYMTLNRQRGEKVTLVNQGELDIQKADYQRRVGLVDHTGVVQKEKMDIDMQRYRQEQLGYTYQQSRGFDVMEKVADNEGSSADLRNAAMGIGLGFGAGEVFKDAMYDIANTTVRADAAAPMNSGMAGVAPMGGWTTGAAPMNSGMPGAAPMSGWTTGAVPMDDGMAGAAPMDDGMAAQQDSMSVFRQKVKKLALMREAGMLTDEEFAVQKELLLAEIRRI